MMCTFDIVHERCAKFNTRRMARMGMLYYMGMVYYQLVLLETILFIKQNRKTKNGVSYAGTSHKVGMV